ncbi:hypothetical protein CHS0354_016113 [Potamilus streckersoni]|uniref:Uncharacterized protein n=1 Tax=Potamilus streckersoni TaxID=2493646 RepID=A0AAE0T1X3_9BIVA|nr:hypothetical protein CHS0354_016113 [Potamilus streckersoni]
MCKKAQVPQNVFRLSGYRKKSSSNRKSKGSRSRFSQVSWIRTSRKHFHRLTSNKSTICHWAQDTRHKDSQSTDPLREKGTYASVSPRLQRLDNELLVIVDSSEFERAQIASASFRHIVSLFHPVAPCFRSNLQGAFNCLTTQVSGDEVESASETWSEPNDYARILSTESGIVLVPETLHLYHGTILVSSAKSKIH